MPLPIPSNVSASLIYSTEDSYNASSWYDPLVRVYQTDGQGTSELKDVADDLAITMNLIDPLNGYRVEVYETDISGFLDCLHDSNCDPYQYGRDAVWGLCHWMDGGGNIFIHPNDDGDSANEGRTFGGANHNNHISMPKKYNEPRFGPISIKGSETRDSHCRDRGIYWAPAHEMGHQFVSPTAWWNDDYGTSSCDDDNERNSHYFATNLFPCSSASDSSIDHHTIMSQFDRHSDCGDCSSSSAPESASLESSTCFDNATDDCISQAKNNL